MTRKYRAPNDLRRSYADIYPYVETTLSFQDYRKFMTEVFSAIIREIIINKRLWALPFDLGHMFVHSEKKHIEAQPIDFNRSKKLGKPVRHRNMHTDRRIFAVRWVFLNERNIEGLVSWNVYTFRVYYKHRKFLSRLVKELADDPNVKSYTTPYEVSGDPAYRMYR